MVVNAVTKTCKWMLYLLVALLLLIALLAASVRLAVFYSEDYSDQVASIVTSYVGSPVEIGEVDLVWNRFDASASLKDVQIRSADGKETVLELPRIELQLDVRDILLQRTLSVRSVQLSGLSLAGSYEGPGKFRMLGASLNPDDLDSPENMEGRGSSALSWLLNAKRLSILDSDITLIDATMNREYKIDDVNISAYNVDDLHQIRISNSLPGEIGEASLASFDFTGDADNIDEWKGKFYVNTEGLNIDQLSGFWRETTQQVSGHVGMQAWGSFSGMRLDSLRLVGACESLLLSQPSADGNGLVSLDARDVVVDLDWQRLESGWQLGFNRFSAVLDNNKVQLDGMDVQLTDEGNGKYISVAGPDIDLQSLVPAHTYIDTLLPDDAPFSAHALRQGLLKNWRVSGIVGDEKNILTELKVTAVDLGIDSLDQAPGISALTTAVVFQDGVGKMIFDSQDITLTLPSLYESPLPVINIDGELQFVLNADTPSDNEAPEELTEELTEKPTYKPLMQWKVVSEDLRLSSPDLNTSSTFSFTGLSDGSRLIESHTTILNANLAGIQGFYPARIIPPKTLNYMKVALVGGDITGGRVELKGDLNDFSPYDGRGHFYSEIDVADTTVKFHTKWPALENVDGNLKFSAAAMRGRLTQGSMRDAEISDARLYVPDIKAPVMSIDGSLIGPVSDMLDFAQTGPLASLIARAFGNSTGSGTSRLNLDLQVPMIVRLKDQLSIDGSVVLNNAQINSKTFGVNLESVTGDVRFNRSGIITDQLQVSYQGLPLSIKAIQEREPGKTINRIRVGGPMAAASVLQSYKIPLVDQFDGVSNWNLDIDVTRTTGVKKRRIELTAVSDLSGTAIKFPAPLSKKADELREGRIYRDFGAAEKDWWIEIPGLVKIRSRTADGGGLQSMAIALGNSNSSVLPRRGISLSGNSHRLDAHGWVQWVFDFQSGRKKSADAEPFPFFANIKARQMTIGNQVFDELAYTAYRDGNSQVHRFSNSMVSGELVLGQSPWVVRLDQLDRRLLLAIGDAESASKGSGEVTDQSYDPRDVPALDVTVSELIRDNWRFAKVALRTEPSESGMRITAIRARQDTMRLSGSGFWEQSKNRGASSHVTKLDVTASFDDFGQALSDIAGVQSFGEGTGEAALSIAWPKPGYAPDLQAMQGQLLFNLRDGRILSVQPGASRILGLVALQSLPRRLAGDFRDITETGLEYSGVSGNLSIADGYAITNAIAMSGPVAEILIQGTSGFVDRTHEQTIDVLPRVSGALPLLGILSVGPAAGLTALLADNILKGIGVNLDEFGRRRYMLTGSWEQPVWDNF